MEGEIGLYSNNAGGGATPDLQHVLNAGHIATVAGGGATIQLEDGTYTNSFYPSGNNVSNATNLAEMSVNGFLAQVAGVPNPIFSGFDSTHYNFTDANGNTFNIDFSTGVPVLTYTKGGNVMLITFPSTVGASVNQIFKDASGAIALDNQVNAQTGTTYTFAIKDAFNTVTGNNAATQLYTIPPHATIPFTIGCMIIVLAIGAGKITVAPGAGVTLSSAGSLFSTATSVGSCIMQTSNDNWTMLGNLIA